MQWVGRAGITHLALAAIDIALWDLRAKAAGLPLWKLLGGATKRDARSLQHRYRLALDRQGRLVAKSRRAVEHDGFRRLKIKVGHDDPMSDIDRIEAVRSGGRAATSPSPSTATASGTCRPACASARAPKRSTSSGSRSRCGTTTSRSHAALARFDLDPDRARRAALQRGRLHELHRRGRGRNMCSPT